MIIDHREGAEAEAAGVDEFKDFADLLLRTGLNWFLDEAMDMVLHTGDFLDLLLVAHVVVDQSETTVERHLDRHLRFGHSIHVR